MANNVLPDPLNTNPVAKDYQTEVALGNITGSVSKSIVMYNPSVSTSLVDIWGGGGNLSYPTAGETWEVLSSSANDTTAGSGAQSIIVNSLTTDYIQQTEVVALNGTTPVVLSNTHFRPDGAVALPTGAGQENAGDITIRVSGGGATRQFIPAGFGASQDTHFTVPAGKTLIGLRILSVFPKNEDGILEGSIMPFGTNTWIRSGRFSIYQNILDIPFIAKPIALEKTDIRYQVNSTNVGPIVISAVLEFELRDN